MHQHHHQQHCEHTHHHHNPFVSESNQHSSSDLLDSDYQLALMLSQQMPPDTPPIAQDKMQCSQCNAYFDFSVVAFLDTCEHVLCTVCLRLSVFEQYNEKKVHMQCPLCAQTLSHATIKQSLTASEFESYLSFSLKNCTDNDANFVHCPSCNHTFESVPQPRHKLEQMLKDRNLPIKETNIHREQNRFRCRECDTEFCARCKNTPYHDDFTCSQYQRYLKSQKCRFCHKGITTPSSTASHLSLVCEDEQCLAKADLICTKRHQECYHPCNGVRDETQCLPCLQCANAEGSCTQASDDYCNICWVEELQEAPCIQLNCSHIFHFTCLKKKIQSGYPGARITFGFLKCPLCQELMEHPLLDELMEPHLKLKKTLEEKALQRLKYQNLDKSDDIVKEKGKFYNQPLEFAVHNFAYYPCFECKEPYFGGMRQCDQNAGDGNVDFKPEHLICGKCSAKQCGHEQRCPKHGSEYILYKCRFCCNPSTWFCWGSTRFCDSCHSRQVKDQSITKLKKHELPKCEGPGKCPVGGKHAPQGVECIVGCLLCADAAKDF